MWGLQEPRLRRGRKLCGPKPKEIRHIVQKRAEMIESDILSWTQLALQQRVHMQSELCRQIGVTIKQHLRCILMLIDIDNPHRALPWLTFV